MQVIFKSRPVEILGVDVSCSDPVDAFIEKAAYMDGDQADLSEGEIDDLNQEGFDLYDYWFNHQIDRAEHYSD